MSSTGILQRRTVLYDASGNPVTVDQRGSKFAVAVELVDASGNLVTTMGQGAAAANSGKWPVKIINSDDTDNSLSTGGQIGQKVMVVGDGDKYVRGVVAEGAAVSSIEPVFIGGKDLSGNARGITAKVLDSRTGLHAANSSIESKQIINQNSLNAPSGGNFPLTAGQVFNSGWIDTQGYAAIVLAAVDNTSGGSPCQLEEHWSSDGVNDIFQGGATIFLAGGLGPTYTSPFLFGTKRTIAMRYVKYIWTNGATNQGTGTPAASNFVIFTADLLPMPIAYDANIVNRELRVVGSADQANAVFLPVGIGGVDNMSSPTQFYQWLMNSAGQGAIKGIDTNYTNTPLITVRKLQTSASPGTTAVTVATSSTQVFASNTDRLGFSIYNEGGAVVKLKHGTAASSTSFDWILQPYDFLYVTDPGYSGVVHHIGDVAVGTLRCCEW